MYGVHYRQIPIKAKFIGEEDAKAKLKLHKKFSQLIWQKKTYNTKPRNHQTNTQQ